MNTELFRKINDVISRDRGGLNMDSWENVCGTTRCVAGWAIYFEAGEVPLYADSTTGRYSDGVMELAARVGVSMRDSLLFPRLGAKLLGLRCSELFYVDDDLAARFVALAAEGRDEEALALLEGDR